MTPAISPRHSRLKTWCDHEFLPFWKMTFTLAIKKNFCCFYINVTHFYTNVVETLEHTLAKNGEKMTYPFKSVAKLWCFCLSMFSCAKLLFCPHGHHSAPSRAHVLAPKQLQLLKLGTCTPHYMICGAYGCTSVPCLHNMSDQEWKSESYVFATIFAPLVVRAGLQFLNQFKNSYEYVIRSWSVALDVWGKYLRQINSSFP